MPKPRTPHESINRLLEKLDIFRPSLEEMISEIAQAGLSIKLEKADVGFFETHKEEVIVSMWKVVKVAKIMEEQNIDVDLNLASHYLKKKSPTIN